MAEGAPTEEHERLIPLPLNTKSGSANFCYCQLGVAHRFIYFLEAYCPTPTGSRLALRPFELREIMTPEAESSHD